MKTLIFADEPTKEEANERLYRPGMLWARGYKPAIPVAGVRMLEREVASLTEAGFEVTIVGDPEKPYRLLGDSVEYINPGHSLGDKIRSLMDYGDELIAVGGCDMCPSKTDATGVYNLFKKHEDSSFIAPMVRGQALVDIGFRNDIHTKIYRFRDDHYTSERLAFPQLFALKPAHFHLEIAAYLSDIFYKTREKGCDQSFCQILKAYWREKHTDESPNLFRFATNLGLFLPTYYLAKHRIHDYPVVTYERARTIVGGIVGKVPAHLLTIVPNDYKTIACDIDTEDELAIVERLIAEEKW